MTIPIGFWRTLPGWCGPDDGPPDQRLPDGTHRDVALLQWAAARVPDGRVIVEIGSWAGRSAFAMAEVARVPIFCFDPYPEVSQAADTRTIAPSMAQRLLRDAVEATGANIVLETSDGAVAGRAWQNWRLRRPVGLLHVDGDHTYEQVRAELEAWLPHLSDDAVVVFDDWLSYEGQIQRACAEVLKGWPVVLRGYSRFAAVRAIPPDAPAALRIDLPPSVSVVVPTFRLGGIDCLKFSMDRQSYPHERTELVLVDALYERRKDAVARFFAGADYRVVHLPPQQLPGEPPVFPRDMFPRTANTGLLAASGDIVVFWCDYAVAQSTTIGQHVWRMTSTGTPIASVGVHLYGLIIRLHRLMATKDLAAYQALLASLSADSPLWISAFVPRDDPDSHAILALEIQLSPVPLEEAIEIAMATAALIPFDQLDPKLRIWSGNPCPWGVHLKNEAFRRADLVALRGFDETYNDTHCAVDNDLGMRLERAGVTPMLDKGNEILVPNPRPFTPELARAVRQDDALHEWQTIRVPQIRAGEVLARKSILP